MSTSYTPALGRRELTGLYDLAIALLTRETIWRGKLVRLIAPRSGDRILDVGCGTGTLAIALKKAAPQTEIIGLDPDPDVLARASAKAHRDGVSITWRNSFLTADLIAELGPFTAVTSSLVLHQTPLDVKQRILELAYAALALSGRIVIADYGLQRTRLLRALFRRTVQQLDGYKDTQPNADGVLPSLITKAGFTDVCEVEWIPTPTGSISLYMGRRR